MHSKVTSSKLEASEYKLKMQEKSETVKLTESKLNKKFIDQDKTIDHQRRQINDLKDTIALKITVADDLSNLLKQQKNELRET